MNAAQQAALAHHAELNREAGWEAAIRQVIADSSAVAAAAAPLWKHPRHAELEQRRRIDHRPCPRRCGHCSRCIHAEAWVRRGCRPYLGVEQERALAATGGDR